MKGVILKRCPRCRIVDLSHLVQRHNIVEGAFLLESSVLFFPRGTIHVGVVDPGVGSRRLPIIVACRSGVLVGPDNGLLSLAADRLGFECAYRIRESKVKDDYVSSTFHGRDVFAVVAAELARGVSPRIVGTSLKSIQRLRLERPKVSKDRIRCVVLHVDIFGNIITNVRSSLDLEWLSPGRELHIEARGRSLKAKFARTYSEVGVGKLSVLRGSQGYLEIAARERSALESLGVVASEGLVIVAG